MERPTRTASKPTANKDDDRSKPSKGQPAGAPKVVGAVRSASTAQNSEVAPLRAEMKRKIESAGPKGRSSPGENG